MRFYNTKMISSFLCRRTAASTHSLIKGMRKIEKLAEFNLSRNKFCFKYCILNIKRWFYIQSLQPLHLVRDVEITQIARVAWKTPLTVVKYFKLWYSSGYVFRHLGVDRWDNLFNIKNVFSFFDKYTSFKNEMPSIK